MLGAYGLPGQRELVRADERSDYALVLKQWSALVVYLTFAFCLAVANILIIGPWLGFSTGLVCSLVFATWLTAATRDKPIMPVGIVVSLAIIIIWLILGMPVIESFWWDVRCDWEPRNKALFSGFSILILCATSLPVYRFSYEIIDPRWPPTVGIRDAEWGPMWPWAQIPQEYEEEVERQPEIRTVPKPVPTPRDSKVRVMPELPPDPARVERNGHKTIMSPSGREVIVSDLVSFIRLAPTLGTSFTGVWKKRGWKHQQWGDVVDVWAIYSVTSDREERKEVKVLVPDFTEAMGRLSSAFD